MHSFRLALGLGAVTIAFCSLSAAALEDVPHPAVLAARAKFEAQVAAAVDPVRSRYVSELKGLKARLTRDKDLKGVESVEAELALLDEVDRLWERHALQGLWEVKYSNGSVRTYRISNTGEVQFMEERRSGRIIRAGGDYLLELNDGKIERLTLEPTIKLEHFDPKTTYPLGAPRSTGTGVPTRR